MKKLTEGERNKLLDLLREYRWAFHDYMIRENNDEEYNLDDMNEAQKKVLEMFENR